MFNRYKIDRVSRRGADWNFRSQQLLGVGDSRRMKNGREIRSTTVIPRSLACTYDNQPPCASGNLSWQISKSLTLPESNARTGTLDQLHVANRSRARLNLRPGLEVNIGVLSRGWTRAGSCVQSRERSTTSHLPTKSSTDRNFRRVSRPDGPSAFPLSLSTRIRCPVRLLPQALGWWVLVVVGDLQGGWSKR